MVAASPPCSISGTLIDENYGSGTPSPAGRSHQQWAPAGPDGRRRLRAMGDKVGQVWDAISCGPRGPPVRAAGGLVVARFSLDGRSILTQGNDGTARVWEVGTGRPLTPPLKNGGAVF